MKDVPVDKIVMQQKCEYVGKKTWPACKVTIFLTRTTNTFPVPTCLKNSQNPFVTFLRYFRGSLSLSTVGNKCAKDNFGDFIKSLTNFSIQKSI